MYCVGSLRTYEFFLLLILVLLLVLEGEGRGCGDSVLGLSLTFRGEGICSVFLVFGGRLGYYLGAFRI